MTVMWLVASTDERGIADAEARGWIRIAAKRFATAQKHDIRVVRAMADLVVGQTSPIRLIKGGDYETGPAKGPEQDPLAWLRWEQEKPEFDKLVASGAAIWVDPDAAEERAGVRAGGEAVEF